MALEMGRELLEEYGLKGLSSMLAAALIKARDSGPRVRKFLFRTTIQEVGRIAVEAGLDPGDLCEAAMDILEISHQESARLRKESAEKRRTEAEFEVEKALMELEGECS